TTEALQPNEVVRIEVKRITQANDPDPLNHSTSIVLNTNPNLTGDVVTTQADHSIDLFAPAVTITKTADVSAATFGATITYTITFDNQTDTDTDTPGIQEAGPGGAPDLILDGEPGVIDVPGVLGVDDTLLNDATVLAALKAAGLDVLSVGESGSFQVT